MLKMMISKQDFDKRYKDWQYVDLRGVEKNRFVVTKHGEIVRIEENRGDRLKIAVLESMGRKNIAGFYMTTFSAGIEYPTAKVVATAFVAKDREEQDRIYFKDHDKENVSADNLVWMTHKELMRAHFDDRKAAKSEESYSEKHQLTDFIENLMAEDDLKCLSPQKPHPDAQWDDDLKDWVIFSHEYSDEELTRMAEDTEYEPTEKEERAEEIKSNKQLRLAYKWGNVKQQNNDYDPEGEF